MSSSNNRLNNHRRSPVKRFAVLTNYGNREHVECIAVSIQVGRSMLDSRLFWSRDYQSGEGLTRSVFAWAMGKGAKEIRQLEEVFPIDDNCPPKPRLLN